MALYFDTHINDLAQAVREAIAGAWPDVVAHNIYQYRQITAVPWEQEHLPFASFKATDFGDDPEHGIDNIALIVQIEIWRAQQDIAGGESVLQQLGKLTNYLYEHDLPRAGQVQRVDSISDSEDLYPNQLFKVKRYTQLAGRVVVTCLMGEIVNA